MTLVTEKFRANGMHCPSCDKLIERATRKINGVELVSARYATQLVEVTYDNTATSQSEIFELIDSKGYQCVVDTPISSTRRIRGILFGLIGIGLILFVGAKLIEGIDLPEIGANMSYGVLFLVGLLTGFHCIGMCGAFVVGYSTKNASLGPSPYRSHFLYGFGKVISYTVIGALFGLLGSIIAFTPAMRGVAAILAGSFLLLYGLNMLNVLPSLRKFTLRTPASVQRFVNRESSNTSNPLIIGLLNGLMIACGPLQAMYVMAAGTGSALEGAKMLFVFGLGTLPLLLGFGALTSVISGSLTRKILKFSGFLVIFLGLIMVNRGLSMTGTGYDMHTVMTVFKGRLSRAMATPVNTDLENGYQVINMKVTAAGYEPNKFYLKPGVPIKWVIDGQRLTGCNKAISVPNMGLEFDLKEGKQVIELEPMETGSVAWSCWMGMIPGTFIVADEASTGLAAGNKSWGKRGRNAGRH